MPAPWSAYKRQQRSRLPAPAGRRHLARGHPRVNVQQARTGTGNDRAAQAPPPRQSDLHGRAVITPATAVVLLSGVVLVLQDDISRGALGESWIVWALTAVLGSLILGRR
jgi:hypothetical protein